MEVPTSQLSESQLAIQFNPKEDMQSAVVERLLKDNEKRFLQKERESKILYRYEDDRIVKKDIFYEYDYLGTLRSDLPGDKSDRLRQFSPIGRKTQIS